ncbi:hypothetical protein HP564_00305 [Pantoea sp. KPR_PJ]
MLTLPGLKFADDLVDETRRRIEAGMEVAGSAGEQYPGRVNDVSQIPQTIPLTFALLSAGIRR